MPMELEQAWSLVTVQNRLFLLVALRVHFVVQGNVMTVAYENMPSCIGDYQKTCTLSNIIEKLRLRQELQDYYYY